MAQPDVLVVEDDRELNEMVGAYASLAGFTYRPALSGSSALAEARRQPPAVILLDLMLPDISGFDVCRQVKRDEQTHDVPVVLLTALDGAESRQRGRECGAAEYLTKPFDPDVLLQTLTRHARPNGRP